MHMSLTSIILSRLGVPPPESAIQQSDAKAMVIIGLLNNVSNILITHLTFE